jgi:hypothetical protein
MAHRPLSKTAATKAILAALLALMIITILFFPFPVEPGMTTADHLVKMCRETVSALTGLMQDINAN